MIGLPHGWRACALARSSWPSSWSTPSAASRPRSGSPSPSLRVYFLFDYPTIVIIAIFVFLGAGQEAAYVSDQEGPCEELRVQDAMLTDFRSLPQTAVSRDAVHLLLMRQPARFPVLDEDDHFKGI